MGILVTVTLGHRFEVEWTITGKEIELCIPPGEHVDFLWGNGHNLVNVTEDVYEDCSKLDEKVDIYNQPINRKAVAGGDSYTADDGEGTRYFICGVGGHCEHGTSTMQEAAR